MRSKKRRYSGFIKPLFGIIDLVIINMTVFLFQINIKDTFIFGIYITLVWVIISLKNQFYEVQRHTKLIQMMSLLTKQMLIFAIILYAFIGFFKQPDISRLALGYYLINVFFFIISNNYYISGITT